jgi:CBS domain-containing protein
MFLVSQLIARKHEAGTRTVETVSPDTTVVEAAKIMNDQHIGSLVVVGHEGGLVGIVTERDFLRRVIAEQIDPAETTVSQIMTRSILTCTPDTRLDEVRSTMRERRVRHMPIIDAGRLVGMISIGDLNFAESQSLTEQVEQLEMYIRTA